MCLQSPPPGRRGLEDLRFEAKQTTVNLVSKEKNKKTKTTQPMKQRHLSVSVYFLMGRKKSERRPFLKGRSLLCLMNLVDGAFVNVALVRVLWHLLMAEGGSK